MDKITLVVTSINEPNNVLKSLSRGCLENGWSFVLIGDKKSPKNFNCDGINYFSLDAQVKTRFEFALAAPIGHYARKNIGYLIAIKDGAKIIVETDDDNYPLQGFWDERKKIERASSVKKSGWVNAYHFFCDGKIWPRGLPLNEVNSIFEEYDDLLIENLESPIQQGLADTNPDVDAIYRLVFPLPFSFIPDRRISLGKGVWCPFNSQNTTWWSDAFPLLYLPSYCSFRMTDIWRSFIAQRIAWENGWVIQFHSPTVWQDRNEHDLMIDFVDEIPGYLNNNLIKEKLSTLSLKSGAQHIGQNMLSCYKALVEMDVVGEKEIALLKSWLKDLNNL